MGNCQTSNCCKKNEKGSFDVLQEISSLEISKSAFYRNLTQSKESSVDLSCISKNEKNVIYFENGCSYEGDWDPERRRHGFGIYAWSDGSKYTGYWKDNVACGFGKLEHCDGEVYEGNWLNDQANGYGEFRSKEGTVYKGEWLNDLQEGHGLEIWSNLTSYEGEYSKGKKHGKGVLKFTDGAFYEVM